MDKSLFQLWTNGFLDSVHQGVQFSSSEERVLYLKDPSGRDRQETRTMLDQLAGSMINRMKSLEIQKYKPGYNNMRWRIACRLLYLNSLTSRKNPTPL